MACTTLTAPGQACINIPIIRGDTYIREWDIVRNGEPVDLSAYTIKMEIRQGGGPHFSPVKTVTEAGMEISGNTMKIIFDQDDPIFKSYYGVLWYDIAFTYDGVTEHWIKGQILITKSETVTWQTS